MHGAGRFKEIKTLGEGQKSGKEKTNFRTCPAGIVGK